MAKARTFKSNTGSPVRIFVFDLPEPIEVSHEGYETSDEREIDALKGSPEVVEVRQSRKK